MKIYARRWFPHVKAIQRQALVMNKQIELSVGRRDELWRQIIVAKIENQ